METQVQLSDQELVQRFLNGQEKSYFELIERYESKIYSTACYLSSDSQAAESVLQEVLLSLLTKLRNDTGKTALFPWLVQQTIDLSVASLIASTSERRCRDAEEGYKPAEETEELKIQNLIRDAALDLDNDSRYVFVLRDIHDVPLKEIAALLDLTDFEVRRLLRSARREVAARLSASITSEHAA